MAIRDHFALGTAVPGNAASSGDGASIESETDPNTGNRKLDYRAPEPSERQAVSVGDESAHGDVQAYVRAKQTAAGIKPGGGSGFSVGSTDKLVVNDAGLPDDSGIQAGGIGIA